MLRTELYCFVRLSQTLFCCFDTINFVTLSSQFVCEAQPLRTLTFFWLWKRLPCLKKWSHCSKCDSTGCRNKSDCLKLKLMRKWPSLSLDLSPQWTVSEWFYGLNRSFQVFFDTAWCSCRVYALGRCYLPIDKLLPRWVLGFFSQISSGHPPQLHPLIHGSRLVIKIQDVACRNAKLETQQDVSQQDDSAVFITQRASRSDRPD